MKQITLIAFISILSLSCKTEAQQIQQSIHEILVEFNTQNYSSLYNRMYSESDQDIDGIKFYGKTINYVLTKYYGNNINSLKIYPTQGRDVLGRLKFSIPLFDGFDSITGLKKASLELYFGPKWIASFDKLTGWEHNFEYDLDYRQYLYNIGKIPK